ncbi:HWE histidine kinase domain-containing protein [Mesorhizobium sp.]|uniref:sensor histidine kinase n=2 Tax=unclassified Mesorhizobium TaxID=325217 RepID=UPI000F7515D9|nr:HWE histidine kinase domain-containing protein [Mesorhizobium sp.]AZO53488.1 histidine kinase [Mesorhizobium sp. M8A.F.Ca.ET.057.01.1.1]RWE43219.1 MAG: histidine kinase [Mesorhizobium sp.]
MGIEMPRLSSRSYLLGLITAAVVPVWLFAAYLLTQYALNERSRFDTEALQVARQMSLVVEGEINNLATVVKGLSKSAALAAGDLMTLQTEAVRLTQGTRSFIVLRDLERQQLINTQVPYGTHLPPVEPISAADLAKLKSNLPIVSSVHAVSGEFRIDVAIAVHGPEGENWLFLISVPTAHIRDIMMPAVPEGWTIGVGDRQGTYVTRSTLHDEMTGKPGLPAYLEKIEGRSGTFTASNFQGMTLLAGYYRSSASDWFYTANVPLSVVQAPLWRSLTAIAAMALAAMLISTALAYVVGTGFASAARDLASRADALGQGRPVTPMSTAISEFAAIADALLAAERALAEREFELETVLEIAPAAVWFTYDPQARNVIRNRFAAELMGLPTDLRKSFGTPDRVIDTIALQDGHRVDREDRPLSKAMRGEQTDNQEFTYILPSGVQRTLLSSARPIRGATGNVIGAVQVSLDISERKRGEEQRKLLVNELNHRVKNTLAVVQSIASQTLRNADNLPEAGRSLASRLVSLAKAHDILTQENWSGADLRDVITAAISPHAIRERCHLSGDPVWLSPTLALSLSLGFHELTTNAVKYGALACDQGIVTISWTLSRQAGSRQVRIEWREQNGPPVAPAKRKGFGTRMLERLLGPESAGKVSIMFEETGVVCVFAIELGDDDPNPTGRPTMPV